MATLINFPSWLQEERNLTKLALLVSSHTLSTNSSTLPLPAHRPEDSLFAIFPQLPSGQNSVSQTLNFVGFDGKAWTAQAFGGWFIQKTADGTLDEFAPTIAYRDTNDRLTYATRIGHKFLIVPGQPAADAQPCPEQTVFELPVKPARPSACSSWIASFLQVKGPGGSLSEVHLVTPPSFTTPSTFTKLRGVETEFTVTATGSPAPVLSLPNQQALFGKALVTLNGNSAQIKSVSEPIVFPITATNGAGTVTQNITLNIEENVQFLGGPYTFQCYNNISCISTVRTTGGLTTKFTSTIPAAAGNVVNEGGNAILTLNAVDCSPGRLCPTVFQLTATPPTGAARTVTVTFNYNPTPADPVFTTPAVFKLARQKRNLPDRRQRRAPTFLGLQLYRIKVQR